MFRLILACALTAATLGAFAADTSMVVGPDGKPAAPGRYWLVVFHGDGTQPTVSLALEVGGTVPVPPPQPPAPDTVTTQIQTLIAAVTADPTKADTAKGLSLTYGTILQTAGLVKDPVRLRMVAETLVDGVLADPRVMKTSTWKPFTDGMKSLTAPLDLAGVVNAYTIAQGLLGGTAPVPPPQPPPGPVTTAAKAVILIESGNQTPEQARLLGQLRNDPPWSRLVTVLDPQTKDQAGNPDPLAQAAVKAVGSLPLPRVVLLDAAGSIVGSSLPLPGTFGELKTTLTQQGVKP